MSNDNWISVKDKLPTKAGWYKIKYGRVGDECEAPYSSTPLGILVWVVPDESMITHWKEIEEPKDFAKNSIANIDNNE